MRLKQVSGYSSRNTASVTVIPSNPVESAYAFSLGDMLCKE